MAKTNFQDPGSSEIRSTHISGVMEAINKIEESLNMDTVAETDVVLPELFISEDDRYRIFQAPEGKRNWLNSPAPVIKKNGVVISTGFGIDYGGGAVVFNPPLTASDTVTASFTRTKNTSGFNAHLAEGVHQNVSVTNTDDATSVTDAPLKSAGGLAVAKNVYLNNAILLKIENGVCFVKGSLYNREYGFGFWTVDVNKRIAFVFQLEAGTANLMQIAVGGGQSGTGALNRVKCIKKDIAFRLDYNKTINTVVEHTGLISGFDAADVYIEAHPVEANRIILYIENNSTWATRLMPTISIQGGGISTFIESYIEDIPV